MNAITASVDPNQPTVQQQQTIYEHYWLHDQYMITFLAVGISIDYYTIITFAAVKLAYFHYCYTVIDYYMITFGTKTFLDMNIYHIVLYRPTKKCNLKQKQPVDCQTTSPNMIDIYVTKDDSRNIYF